LAQKRAAVAQQTTSEPESSSVNDQTTSPQIPANSFVESPSLASVPEPSEVRQKLREAVKREKMSLETLLGKAESWVWKDSVLEIGFTNGFEMSMAHKEQNYLQGKLKGLYGNHFSLAFRIMKDSSSEPEAAAGISQEDEVIKTFLHVFQGKIVHKGEL